MAGNRTRSVDIPPDMNGLARALGLFTAFANHYGVPAEIWRDLYVALEEVIANVIQHGQPHSPIEMRLSVDARAFSIEVIDDGVPFDPLQAPPPDIDAPLAERPIGGLGVQILRSLAECHYERRNDRNCLTMTRGLGSPSRAVAT